MSTKSTIHTFVSILFFIAVFTSSQAFAVSEVWIDDDFGPSTPGWGVTHFDRIQDGIDAMDAGGTAHVSQGTYMENVVIEKQVYLYGDVRSNVVIDANQSGTALTLNLGAEFSEIQGFRLQNSGGVYPDSGLLINNADNITVTNNTVENCLFGILTAESSNQIICDNQVNGCEFYGIFVATLFGDVSDITVSRNAVSGCGHSLAFKRDLEYGSENVEIADNDFENWVMIEHVETGTISNNLFHKSVSISQSARDIEVRGNKFFEQSNHTYSLNLSYNCKGIEVVDNYFENGVSLNWYSHDNTIIDNYFTEGGHVAINFSCYANLIESNIIISDYIYGVWVNTADDNIIRNNYIQSEDGIGLRQQSDYNIVSGNIITFCSKSGIIFDSESNHNTIKDNLIANNNGLGIRIPGYSECYDNLIYNNFIYGNTGGNGKDGGISNKWDNGPVDGGNYWSDYTGEDLDNDGFGDTPYMVLSQGQDNYPLMEPIGGGALWPDTFVIPASTGATISLTAHGGKENAGRYYLILGTLSGTEPGFTLPGGHATMPLNWDDFTDLVMANLNTPFFPGFLWTLDAAGTANAEINFGPVSPFWVGTIFHFAYTCNNPFDVASNPISIEIVD